jgi:hypothetical protein
MDLKITRKHLLLDFKLSHKKLVDVLLYHDNEYRDNPEYNKKVVALIKKGKKQVKLYP